LYRAEARKPEGRARSTAAGQIEFSPKPRSYRDVYRPISHPATITASIKQPKSVGVALLYAVETLSNQCIAQNSMCLFLAETAGPTEI
jgi:hypothetical protein